MTATESKGRKLGMRHMQTLLIFLNIVVMYISRLNIGVAVVAMTNAETTNPNFDEYDWTEAEKSYIISSFYWGYVFTQFPGGWFSRHFGVKITMLLPSLGSACLSAIIPLCVGWGDWKAYCGIRIAQGFFQGMLFPCIHEHLAKWSPPRERNRLGALSHTGIECGTVLAMALPGLIAHGPLGWPGISYVSAGLSFAWCIFWYVFASNTADESRFISAEERDYIETSLKEAEVQNKGRIPIPWAAIFTSVPFYALLVARCAEAWGLSTIQAEIPSYMNGVLNMEITSNALFSALPFLTMWVLSYVYLVSADIVMKKKLLSLTALRRVINSIALWVPAVGLIAVGFLDEEHKAWAIVLMTINVGFNGGATIGSSLNTIDLSANHAGILMGLVNTVANFVPIFTPLLAGMIVSDKHNRSQWQIVFIIAAVIFFVGNLFYIIFGTAEAQPWNAPDFLLPKDTEKQIEAIEKVDELAKNSEQKENGEKEKVDYSEKSNNTQN